MSTPEDEIPPPQRPPSPPFYTTFAARGVHVRDFSELTAPLHQPYYVATHFFGFQAARLPNIQCSVYDPCCMEL